MKSHPSRIHTLELLLAAGILLSIAPASSSSGNNDAETKSETMKPKNPSDSTILADIEAARQRLIKIADKRIETITEFNQQKAVGIIERHLDFAEEKLAGLPPGRFPWSYDGFEEPDGLVATAGKFMADLEAGKDPFEGKYAEPGGYAVDHALIKKGDTHHLIYIRGKAVSNWPESPLENFGHAISTDLVNWTPQEPVLQCPDSGWDGYQVWAPHIIEHDGKYWMFYTGVNSNACQAIGIATSDDLYHWTRCEKNPVITSGPWGYWGTGHWSDCRDPMVLKDGDTFYCYYTAYRQLQKDPPEGEYCVGVASSKDLLNWTDCGFIRLEHSLTTPPESVFTVKRNGKYYLTYTNYKHGIVYAVSDNPVEGFVEPDPTEIAILAGVSASEIYRDGDDWYISLISHMQNGLHFFEIQRMVWNEDGTITARPMKEQRPE